MMRNFLPRLYAKVPLDEDELDKEKLQDEPFDDSDAGVASEVTPHHLSQLQHRRIWLLRAFNLSVIIFMLVISFQLGQVFKPLDELACLDTPWGKI